MFKYYISVRRLEVPGQFTDDIDGGDWKELSVTVMPYILRQHAA